MARELESLGAVTTLHVRIHSPGGDAFDGIAIYNLLKKHSAKVVVHIDGWALSAASVIAMAGDEVMIGQGAMVMIHEAWSFTYGNAADLRVIADFLDKVSLSIAGVYADRTGETADDMLALMKAETWFTAQEAVDAKIVDTIENVESDTPITNQYTLNGLFRNMPESFAGANHREKPQTPRDVESILRDAGCTRNEAKTAVAELKAEAQRDAELADMLAMVKAMRQG